MATTYLGLTNEVLRELNEVVLTSVNFDSATGIQAFKIPKRITNGYLRLFINESSYHGYYLRNHLILK